MKFEIPKNNYCTNCQFLNQGYEDPIGYCLIYNKSWELSGEDEESWYQGENEFKKPDFCKAKTVEVTE